MVRLIRMVINVYFRVGTTLQKLLLKLVVSVFATAPGYEQSETAVQDIVMKEVLLPGDMDADGKLTIKDVTNLVDTILKKNKSSK